MKFGVLGGLFLGSTLIVSAVQITFRVNMEVQTTTGNFNPASHSVEVHGSFDGWGAGITLAVDPTDASIYQGTATVSGTPGAEIQYKFVINQAGTRVWENNGVGPGGAQNRAFNLPETDQTLPVVYFNNQSTPPGVVAVTFQVNMGVQAEIGSFNPAAHTVEAHGSFDNWGAGIVLSQSPVNTNIYQGTANITGSAGMTIEHKFVINQAPMLLWEGNVGPGGPFGNRTFLLAETNQTLPAVYFNNLTNRPGAGIAVTFQANMALQIARGFFDPTTGVVDVRGPFNNWGTPSALVLTNSLSNESIFMGTLNVSNAAPGSTVAYKFNMNGTWETGPDRTFMLASSAQTLPPRYFNDQGDLGPLSISTVVVFDEMEVTLSWTGGPRVRLQSRTNLTTNQWQEVSDTAGQNSKTMTVPFADPDAANGFYRLIGP
jgi:hypothetical protein